ncbi:uncharacterized protein LOC110430082 isoform X2 [Sorghum bicolor]|uniref:uncharacterized protein LOC110430082 isoform X2 n=1 Tax=Sorghum bicolor TaxID=4558 RepID=UPI000B4259A7|nr:uncharacterized protein LOC110430082 isoform X2 [Sorghum bicolor]|eukprot:XP_021302702.1 uncharacterized protein LOC110430082 isoform X2 [Sorghum bicolor]
MSHQCALCLALHLRLGYPALEPSLRLCTSASPVGPPRAAGLPGPRIAASVFLWATGASVGFSTFASPSSTVRLQPRRRSSGHTTFHSLNSLHCFYLLVRMQRINERMEDVEASIPVYDKLLKIGWWWRISQHQCENPEMEAEFMKNLGIYYLRMT